MLISGTHERAHYAFVLAAGAAAVGRGVVLFATNDGCRALLADWSALADPGRDAAVRAHGVAGLGELRDAAAELGVRLIACEAGLRMAGLDGTTLAPGVEIAGITTFLEAAKGGQIVSL
nr:DsrE/DsrF/DrsH-like family protein [Limobrevibacterium gyesilva]